MEFVYAASQSVHPQCSAGIQSFSEAEIATLAELGHSEHSL